MLLVGEVTTEAKTWLNPADSPIMIIGLTSDTLSRGEMYDAAATVLAQKLAQVEGVGQVTIGGSALPAVCTKRSPVRCQPQNGVVTSMREMRRAAVSSIARSK